MRKIGDVSDFGLLEEDYHNVVESFQNKFQFLERSVPAQKGYVFIREGRRVCGFFKQDTREGRSEDFDQVARRIQASFPELEMHEYTDRESITFFKENSPSVSVQLEDSSESKWFNEVVNSIRDQNDQLSDYEYFEKKFFIKNHSGFLRVTAGCMDFAQGPALYIRKVGLEDKVSSINVSLVLEKVLGLEEGALSYNYEQGYDDKTIWIFKYTHEPVAPS